MLSVSSGHSVGYLTGPVASGRESYYTGTVAAGEPAGLWYGAGATALGLSGEVDADLIEAIYAHLMDPRDPAAQDRATWGAAGTLGAAHRAYRSADELYRAALVAHPGAGPEQRAELRAQADSSARQAVSFLDATFSAPKSVTILGVAFERAAVDALAAGDARAAQAWGEHQRAVEAAVLAGARASLDYLQDAAGYSRVGHHGGGAGRWIDAHGFTVAQFLQHDSRDRDPQLHVHQAILNRVECADGGWRSLDGRAIHEHRGAAGAIGERVMEAYLTAALGVTFAARPDGHGREVVGVSREAIDLFSSRRVAITERAERLVAAYTARHGREPSPLERTRISQQATLATRASKTHAGESQDQRLDRWDRELRAELAGGLSGVADLVLGLAQTGPGPDRWTERDVIARALAGVGENRQAWSRSDLTRAVSDALPGNLGVGTGDLRALLEGLTDAAIVHATRLTPDADDAHLPKEWRLDNGRSVYDRPGGERYSTPGQLAAEQALREAAVERGAERLTDDQAGAVVSRLAESGRVLGVDQAAAVVGVLTSGARVEVLSAAAGTGKSFVVGALADAWTAAGHQVFGLAPSQIAAQVLAEDGVIAANTSAWLTAQHRLDHAAPGRADRLGDDRWILRSGDLVVVDEAGMASTTQLAEIAQRCEAADAKLLLVGDPQQLPAVGAGGAMADIAERGLTYDLTEVRRFDAEWERTASLQLRDADPAALDDYARHGRLVDGGTVEQAETAAARAWLADTIAGREALLVVGSNDAAGRVSAALRAELVALGRVAEQGVLLGRQGTTAGVGDVVQARENGWALIGRDGNTQAPLNRGTYEVVETRPDGSILVHGGRANPDGAPGRLVLPAEYVAEQLTLAYASTVHAAQGRTVDTAHAVIGAGTDAAAAYVALTRGREANTAWTVTRATTPDARSGEALEAEPRSARAVLGDVLNAAQAERSAHAQQEQAQLDARSAMTAIDQLVDVIGHLTGGRTGGILDQLTADGTLTAGQREALAADEATDTLDRLLRTVELAGHDPATVLADVIAGRSLAGSDSFAQVLYSRVSNELRDELGAKLTSAADLIPAGVPAEWQEWLSQRADAADDRRHQLGTETAAQAPKWAVEALGPVPDDPIERAEWEHSAGWAATYREVAGHTDDANPLGSAPPGGLAEKVALFQTAHAALDLPTVGADEASASEGRLRVRVTAYEREKAWAPAYVADRLDTTSQAADRHRENAELWAARAEVTHDPSERDRLHADAAAAQREADALAEQTAQLEVADQARAEWLAATAVTRDKAVSAGLELTSRGVTARDTDEQTTAPAWLDAHRAEQTEADVDRPVRDEAELHDPARDSDDQWLAEQPDHGPPLETEVPDIRDTSTVDPGETVDPVDRDPVPPVDQTRAAVERAQDGLRELQARAVMEQAHAHDEIGHRPPAAPAVDERAEVDEAVLA